MDAWVAGLVTAIGGSIAAIFGGWALIQRAMVPHSELRAFARSLWDWITFTKQVDDVPEHIRHDAVRLKVDRRTSDDEDDLEI